MFHLIYELPSFKSSTKSVWPVSMSIKEYVFPLAMTRQKAWESRYSKYIVDEFDSLLENGIRVGSKLYKFRLKCLTCDAKSFLKGQK